MVMGFDGISYKIVDTYWSKSAVGDFENFEAGHLFEEEVKGFDSSWSEGIVAEV